MKNIPSSKISVVRPGPSNAQMLAYAKRTAELRKQRRTITTAVWVIAISFLASIHYSGERKEAAYQAAKICKQTQEAVYAP